MTFTSTYSYIYLCSVLYLSLHLFIIQYYSKLNNNWNSMAFLSYNKEKHQHIVFYR